MASFFFFFGGKGVDFEEIRKITKPIVEGREDVYLN